MSGMCLFPFGDLLRLDYLKYEEEITVRPLHFLQWELPVRLKEQGLEE